MKLSVITVNFNNKEGLNQTAASVVKQSFRDFEWLVVDGGSTDGSLDILQLYSSHLSWCISEPDGGIYEAMNKGLARARGEYVQFLNSGDYYLDSDILEKVFSDPALADVNYGDQWCVFHGAVMEKRHYPDQMDLTFLFRAPLGHQASFIKTSIAHNHPYRIKYRISADRAFFLELFLSGASFRHLPFPVVYFDTDGIGSHENTKELRRSQFQQIKTELLPEQVVDNIERLIDKSEEFDFVLRVLPLRWGYVFCKWLQKIKWRIRRDR